MDKALETLDVEKNQKFGLGFNPHSGSMVILFRGLWDTKIQISLW